MKEVQDLCNQYYSNVTQIFSNKQLLNYDVIINYILQGCLDGVYIPPRRSLDYCEMKIKNYDVKTDNYYKDGKIVKIN